MGLFRNKGHRISDSDVIDVAIGAVRLRLAEIEVEELKAENKLLKAQNKALRAQIEPRRFPSRSPLQRG